MAKYKFGDDEEDMFGALPSENAPEVDTFPSAPFYPTPSGKAPAVAPKAKVIHSSISAPKEKAVGAPFPENKPAPIPEHILAKLEVEKPDLVAQYRAKMAAGDQGVKDAQDRQDMGSYANIGAKLATDFANSQKNDTVYHNSWNKMGNAPQIQKADRPEYDGSAIDKIGAQGVDRAKASRAQSENDFMTGEKLADLQTSRSDAQRSREESLRMKDPNSQESKAARDSLMQMAPKFSAGKDFSSMSAAMIEKIAPQAFQASQQLSTQEFTAGENKKNRDSQAALLQTKVNARGNTAADAFKSLPEDKQQIIKGLASKNAEKESIANQIDAMLVQADKAKDGAGKLAIYRQMGKVLNSTEGKDAVGADEAKRLMANLEFAYGNFSNSNSTQFGRDMQGFHEQAMATSASVRGAIKANQAEIDKAYGRSQSAPNKLVHGSDLPD